MYTGRLRCLELACGKTKRLEHDWFPLPQLLVNKDATNGAPGLTRSKGHRDSNGAIGRDERGLLLLRLSHRLGARHVPSAAQKLRTENCLASFVYCALRIWLQFQEDSLMLPLEAEFTVAKSKWNTLSFPEVPKVTV